MPIVDVELKRDLPRARRGYVKYAATAIAAVLFLHGAATFVLHHRLHGQGHGRHHSIDGEPTPTEHAPPVDAAPPAAHAPAAAAHAAAERLKAKPDHKPDGGRPQAPPPRKTPPAKTARPPSGAQTPAKTPPRKTPNLWQPPARGVKVPLDPPPRPPLPKLGDGVALLRADAPEVYDAIDDATVAQRVLPCVEINQ